MYLRFWTKQRREKEQILESLNINQSLDSPRPTRDMTELWIALLDC